MIVDTNSLAGAEIKRFCSFYCENEAVGEVKMADGKLLPICEKHLKMLNWDFKPTDVSIGVDK